MIQILRTGLISISIIVLFAFFNTVNIERWIIMNGCTLTVSGSTNINRFTCEVTENAAPDTINHFNYDAVKKYYPISGSLSIDVTGFNCHNPLMTSDLRKTLKYKEYPKLKIRFISLSHLPDIRKPKDKISGQVDIELSGVIKRVEVEYDFQNVRTNEIKVVGTKQILFSDFNLTPPRKLGGMIKTNNELIITFNLILKSI